MNIIRFHSDELRELFLKTRIATMPELMQALGSTTDRTVLRKLKELSYVSSYSHRGAYYTIAEIIDFDSKGLWQFNNVCFSKHGNLLQTIVQLVEDSESGYFDQELENALDVTVRNALLHLVSNKRIKRTKVDKRYLYHSINSAKGKEQLTQRKSHQMPVLFQSELSKIKIQPDELKAAIILFFSILSEPQRRLYAGLESLRIGYGGDSIVANFFGIDTQTVAKGRNHLLQRDVDLTRERKKGAGRKAFKKNS